MKVFIYLLMTTLMHAGVVPVAWQYWLEDDQTVWKAHGDSLPVQFATEWETLDPEKISLRRSSDDRAEIHVEGKEGCVPVRLFGKRIEIVEKEVIFDGTVPLFSPETEDENCDRFERVDMKLHCFFDPEGTFYVFGTGKGAEGVPKFFRKTSNREELRVITRGEVSTLSPTGADEVGQKRVRVKWLSDRTIECAPFFRAMLRDENADVVKGWGEDELLAFFEKSVKDAFLLLNPKRGEGIVLGDEFQKCERLSDEDVR